MARALTTDTKNQFIARSFRPVIFVQIEFSSGSVYLWIGNGPIVWNAITWQGVGDLGGLSAIRETAELRASGVTATLSGIPNAMLNKVLTEIRQGKIFKIWIGAMDEAGAIVPDPYLAYSGRTDVGQVVEGVETSVVAVTAETRMIDFKRPRERRYTSEDQKYEYAGDLGFDYVPGLQEAQIQWGQGAGIPAGGGWTGGRTGITAGIGIPTNLPPINYNPIRNPSDQPVVNPGKGIVK